MVLSTTTFVDSGSVLTNGVVNNNICWFCTVEQNVDSRMDPNRQIVSPKTRETTNYTVGYLLTHQQVCWSTRWVQQPDCSFCAHFNKWCCPESTKFGAPTVSDVPIRQRPNQRCYLHLITVLNLVMRCYHLHIWPPDDTTCTSCKVGHQMAPLALISNLNTMWHHLC